MIGQLTDDMRIPLAERLKANVPISQYEAIGALSGAWAWGAASLEHWTANDRLGALACRTLVIAAEHDYVPIAEKYALAASLNAELIVIRGSRHGTPFDSISATNAILVALLNDAPLPAMADCECDEPEIHYPLSIVGSLAEQHALGPQV